MTKHEQARHRGPEFIAPEVTNEVNDFQDDEEVLAKLFAKYISHKGVPPEVAEKLLLKVLHEVNNTISNPQNTIELEAEQSTEQPVTGFETWGKIMLDWFANLQLRPRKK